MSENLVAILIPVYKDNLDSFELNSLTQCFKFWGNKYDIYFVKPKTLDITSIQSLFSSSKVAEFEDRYFVNITGYCKLLPLNHPCLHATL